MDRRPLIGITTDVQDVPQPSVVQRRLCTATTYGEAVVRAGGLPLLLVPDEALADHYAGTLDGFVLTGGMDIDVRPLGLPLHDRARCMHPARQRFDLALLGALDRAREKPVLGVCLGMQLMGVHRAGPGALVQHLGDTLATAPAHQDDLHHAIVPAAAWKDSRLGTLDASAHVASNHHQALASAGPLRVLAHSADGVIEAVDDPDRPFYVGVQWHPERTRDERLGQRVIAELVRAAGV